MPLRTSFFWNAASASRRNCASGLAGLPGVVLDLGFELDRGFVEIGALEGFVRRRTPEWNSGQWTQG